MADIECKGALFSRSVSVKTEGSIVSPVFKKNGEAHPVSPSGKLTSEDLLKFNPAWQEEQKMLAAKNAPEVDIASTLAALQEIYS